MSGVGKINTSLSNSFTNNIDNFNTNLSVNSNSTVTPGFEFLTMDVEKYTTDIPVSPESVNKSLLDMTLADIVDNPQAAVDSLSDAVATVTNVLEDTQATCATAIASLVEGVGMFTEAIVDCAAILSTVINMTTTVPIDMVQGLYGLITENDWNSLTIQRWNDTMGFVSNKYVNGWFDKLYQETVFGNWMNDNSYFFDEVRSIGSGVGYVAGIVILTIATAGVGGAAVGGSSAAGAAATTISSTQLGLTAAAAGFGQGTEQAWNEGASLGEGLAYGGANAAWEFIQFALGNEISRTGGLGDRVAKKIVADGGSVAVHNFAAAATRVFGDTVMGGLDGIVRPGANLIYKDGYYDDNNNYVKFEDSSSLLANYMEVFNDAGGFKNVAVNAAVGAVSSSVGEFFELNKMGKDTFNKATEGVSDSLVVSEKITSSIDEALTNEVDLKKTFAGFLVSPLTTLGRFKYKSLIDNVDLQARATSNGLYHFTDLDSASKILDSGFVKNSGSIASYGSKKSFFFAGIPSFQDLVVNLNTFEPKRTAVKITNFDVNDFIYRDVDGAIAHVGDYKFNPDNAELVYLGLFEENGNLVYKEISESDYMDFNPQISNTKIDASVRNRQSLLLAVGREYDFFLNGIDKIKNLVNNSSIYDVGAQISNRFKNILSLDDSGSNKVIDMELEEAFFDKFKSSKASKNDFIDGLKPIKSNVVSNLTENQKVLVDNINNAIKINNRANLRINSTKELTLAMLDKIDDLSKLSVTIDGAFRDINGNFREKYNTAKYIDRITYSGFEAKSIIGKLDELQSRIDMSLPTVERAKQIYELLAFDIPPMRDYTNYVEGHKVSSSLRGLTPNNSTGKSGLVCAGYAQVYRELCERCGIKCDYIRGIGYGDALRSGAAGSHAWNAILDDNKNIIPVDVTWKACEYSSNWFGRSDEFAARHVAELDEMFQDYKPIMNSSYNNLYSSNTSTIKSIQDIINAVNEKYGPGRGIIALQEYINTGDINKITRNNNARGIITSISIDDIKNYIQIYNQISVIVNTMNEKYGPGTGIDGLKKYIQTGKDSVITRDNNSRDMLRNISIDYIINYINGQY